MQGCVNIDKLVIDTPRLWECVHTKVCKQTLGAHKQRSIIAVRAEIGRFPLNTNMARHIQFLHVGSLVAKKLKICHFQEVRWYFKGNKKVPGIVYIYIYIYINASAAEAHVCMLLLYFVVLLHCVSKPVIMELLDCQEMTVYVFFFM